MNNRLVRKILIIAVMVFNFRPSIGYLWEVVKIYNENVAAGGNSLTVDGTEFGGLLDMGEVMVKGAQNAFTEFGYLMAGSGIILLMALVLMIFHLVKSTEITDKDLAFSLWTIIISSVFYIILGLATVPSGMRGTALSFTWQHPVFMLLLFQLPSFIKYRKVLKEEEEDDVDAAPLIINDSDEKQDDGE